MLRRAGILLLAGLFGVLAVIPHGHEIDQSFELATTHLHLDGCDKPNAHFHAADSAKHHHACVACARQHRAGTPELVHVLVAGVTATAVLVVRITPSLASSLLSCPGRGPPR